MGRVIRSIAYLKRNASRVIQRQSLNVKGVDVPPRGLLHIVPHRLSLGGCYSCSAENGSFATGLSNPSRPLVPRLSRMIA